MKESTLKVALAQLAPVWLNKQQTILKIEQSIIEAAAQKSEPIVFSKSLLPGYPFWISLTDGASFDSKTQKELHSHYLQNAVQIEKGDLNSICALAKEQRIAIYLGIAERAKDRGSHSIYCSLVYIDQFGEIKSVHRKLQPTFEERLTWAPGDGNGLQVHDLKDFCVGGLNCWENWMPLSRTALYGMGENLHIAVWPGSDYNTKDITRFIARESRSFVISVSGIMKTNDFPVSTPHLDEILKNAPTTLANGGSCIAGPDGEWILPPQLDKEEIIYSTLHFNRVLEERQNFDPAGHYSRPDITKLILNTERQSIISLGNNE